MNTWLIQDEIPVDGSGGLSLACPNCSRPERRGRDIWRMVIGLRVGCPGCGVTSIVPNIDRQEATE